MLRTVIRKPLLVFLLTTAPAIAGAAEFDIDAGRVVMRRLQYCLDCGSALLVTHVHPGVMVRCPDCGREQPRLADRQLLTQVYQLCKLCLGPLDPHDHAPGDVVECGNCHTHQTLTRDAFSAGEAAEGLGYVPGFPPGSSKKAMLFSPNLPDSPVTPIPIDIDTGYSDLPPPSVDRPVTFIPGPPAPEPTPERAIPVDTPAPRAPEQTPTPIPEAPLPRAVDVPAVTADLFGGERAGAGSRDRFAGGRVLALVDGAPIRASEVERIAAPVLRQMRERADAGDTEQAAEHERTLRREILERLIDRELAVREAAAIGHKPDPTEVRKREQELSSIFAGGGGDLRREAERDVLMADMRRRHAEKPGEASPEAVREFYRANKDKMLQPRLIALDQLVIYQDRTGKTDRRPYRDIALEVSRDLERGARFDDLCERYDEFAPLAGLPRPEPALQPEGVYAAQILRSAGDLRKGAVFGPLFMEGMALFGKVANERAEGPVPFEEAEREIRRRLEGEAAERNLDAWLKRLRQKARIEIY